MENDTDDTGLSRGSFAAPREVTGVETESAKLAIPASSTDQVDSLRTDSGVGRLTTFLESSV